MTPSDIVVIVVLLLIIGAATAYIIKAKKSGRKCIGCPDSGSGCSGSCGTCGCGCSATAEENAAENVTKNKDA